ncbi:hypothetical protein ACFWVM_04255 [Nocardia fluminea]|uniref:hypothetical protein n=1 Tax=Nocardia fluminea TaxID=134984 RepID=UPI00365E6AB5
MQRKVVTVNPSSQGISRALASGPSGRSRMSAMTRSQTVGGTDPAPIVGEVALGLVGGQRGKGERGGAVQAVVALRLFQVLEFATAAQHDNRVILPLSVIQTVQQRSRPHPGSGVVIHLVKTIEHRKDKSALDHFLADVGP